MESNKPAGRSTTTREFDTFYWLGVSIVSERADADRAALDAGDIDINLNPFTPGRPPIPAPGQQHILGNTDLQKKIWLGVYATVPSDGKPLSVERSQRNFSSPDVATAWLKEEEGINFKKGKALLVLLEAYVDYFLPPSVEK